MDKTKEEKKLIVKMLGDFSVTWGDENISLGRNPYGKLAQLFQILMLAPGGKVSKEKLMVDLYKYDECSNQNNSINNGIYRLRKIFSQAGIPGGTYISSENGFCTWDPAIPVEVDALEFARLIREGREAELPESLELLYQAWNLYRGDLLARNSMEEWVIPETLYYKQLYRECTRLMGHDLLEQERYEDLYTLYSKASGIEPCEEWHLGQLDALMAMGEYDQAYRAYEKMTQDYTAASGRPASEEMLRRLRSISRHLKGGYENIHDIQRHLLDADTGENMGSGAYKCSYPNFVDVYCFLKRMAERVDIPASLMQCTIVNRQKVPAQNKSAYQKGELLSQAIKSSLRSGDIYTRYNTGQFLIILNQAELRNCRKIFSRIMVSYEKLGGNRRDVACQITPIRSKQNKK